MSTDPHSYSRPREARIKHLNLSVNVLFDQKRLACEANYIIETYNDAAEIILDTKALQIKKIFYNDSIEINNYRKGKEDPILGEALYIPLHQGAKSITIQYETSNDAAALQWLSGSQTNSGAAFLFSQSQAILCRSWIPIQDSPSIKFTYSATVKVPDNYLALMSATNPQKVDSSGLYHFEMDKPIPAYLMALAVGEIDFYQYDSVTGVYAEPNTLALAKNELEDLNRMVKAAEKLYGQYLWGRFDVLMLPPSFPFGGMENPKLTFATPTILAGDKSLTSLIAHELAHSWSGNLVTNASWDDFWLNEGFTVYFEYRIMEEVFGKPYADMLALISLRELKEEVSEMLANGQAKDTRLKLDLAGRDPDEGMTAVAYDKGYFFLKRLEEIVGRQLFDKFLQQYFQEYAFKSMTTEAFILYAEKHLFVKNKINFPAQLFDEWIYGEGLPHDLPIIESIKYQAVEDSLRKWLADQDNNHIPDSAWSTHEWLHFMHQLPDSISKQQLILLDSKMNFTQSKNAEIQTAWYQLGLQHDYKNVLVPLEYFLIHTGRRKFLMPLYTSLIKYDRNLAKGIYKKARPNYHFVAVNSLDKLLDNQ